MKDVLYYHNITKSWITVNVSNTVAEYLKKSFFEEKEQRRQIAIHEVSVDGFENGQEYLRDNTLNPYSLLIEKEYGKEPTQKEIWLKLLDKALKKLNKDELFIIEKIFWHNYKKIEISRKYKILIQA